MAEYKKGEAVKLSEDFNTIEFDCKGSGCCSKTIISSKLVIYLQQIRDHFNAPITINSAYRCATHNANVGGAKGSKHTQGMAADISVKGVKPAEVAKYAESIGILGIGLYETAKDGYFVHIDTRTVKSFWYGQAQAKRSTFGGAPVNPVLEWQKAAIADGFKFPKYGADGDWGTECIAVAKQAIIKRRITYKYYNLTKIVQKAVGATVDGKCGINTVSAIKTYQKAHGLTADGEVGLNTWRVILGLN